MPMIPRGAGRRAHVLMSAVMDGSAAGWRRRRYFAPDGIRSVCPA